MPYPTGFSDTGWKSVEGNPGQENDPGAGWLSAPGTGLGGQGVFVPQSQWGSMPTWAAASPEQSASAKSSFDSANKPGFISSIMDRSFGGDTPWKGLASFAGLMGGLNGLSGLASGGGGLTGGLDSFGGSAGWGGDMSALSSGASLPAGVTGAADPIEAMHFLTQNGMTATEAATKLGFQSPEALLSSVNPSWAGSVGSSLGGLDTASSWQDTGASGGAPGGWMSGISQSLQGLIGNNPLSRFLPGAAGGAGSMPWGSPGNLISMGSSFIGLLQSMKQRRLAEQMQKLADPYADRRNALMADPSSITKLPGYQSGLQAVQRAGAAQGWTGSGNMMDALANYGGNFYNQEMARLSGNPAGSAAVRMAGEGSANDLLSRSLASLGYGVARA